MEGLSLDLRERICTACDEQTETRQEVADRFEVSRSFVQKLLRRRRDSGSIAAKPHGRGPTPRIGERDRRRLRDLVSAEPRTGAALGLAAAHGFASVTAADAKGWFEKCGYCVH